MNQGAQTYALPANSTDPHEFGWRQVPKINMLPESRLSAISPLVVLLVIVLLAEAVAAQILHRQLQDGNEAVIAATHRLNQAQRSLSVERDATDREALRMNALNEKIAEIEAQDANVLQAYTQLALPRPDWAATLQALLQADRPDFRLDRLTADGPGTMRLSATATGPDGIREFLAHMSSVNDILGLADWDSGQGDTKLTVDAVVDLK